MYDLQVACIICNSFKLQNLKDMVFNKERGEREGEKFFSKIHQNFNDDIICIIGKILTL
jgi:hypothetical protein